MSSFVIVCPLLGHNIDEENIDGLNADTTVIGATQVIVLNNNNNNNDNSNNNNNNNNTVKINCLEILLLVLVVCKA